MATTCIGMVTFGGLNFTRLAVEELWRTVRQPVDVALVIGQPGDEETRAWATEQRAQGRPLDFLCHTENRGFAASINDLYDYAFENRGYYQLIIMGNDVVVYPGAVDAMIHHADTTNYEWIAASQFDVESLIRIYPETGQYFHGSKRLFTNFEARPWDENAAAVAAAAPGVEANPEGPALIKDVRNLCLFKRSVFEKLGYADVNFWPNGYYEDNDYARRAVNAGIKSCALSHAIYFHFWSRTVNQTVTRAHGRYFDRNGAYYHLKWGGNFAQEKHTIPFGGEPYQHASGATLPGSLKIADRDGENQIIQYWSTLT